MEDFRQSIQKMGPVYDLFASELEAHLVFFHRASKAYCLGSADIDFSATSQVLEQRLHLIKGGAGFLKLETIRALAESGEQWFKNHAANEPEQIAKKAEAIASKLCDELVKLKSLLSEKE